MKTFDFTVFSGLQATTRSARLSSQTALALGHKVAAASRQPRSHLQI